VTPALPDGNRMYVSLFAGIEGFGIALDAAGWQCHTRCEIDDYCNRVTRGWLPVNCKSKRDVRRTSGTRFHGVGLVCGGFPCQDLSVAGKRKGLSGKRSGLFHELVRIVAEARPRWLLWENVPGLLSSDGGRDFWRVNAALAEIGYFGAWRVLDSQYFGVAQRRRRLFGLYAEGDSGARRAAAVLLEPESSGWNPAAGCSARQGDRWTPEGGAGGAGGEGVRSEYYSHDYNQDRIYSLDGVAPAHTATDSNRARNVSVPDLSPALTHDPTAGKHCELDGELVASSLQASMGHHGHSSPRGDGGDNIVVSPLGMSGHNGGMMPNTDAVVGGHLVAFNPQSGGDCWLGESDVPGALQACQTPAVAFCERTRAEGRTLESQEDLSYALTNPGSGGRTNCGQILAPRTGHSLKASGGFKQDDTHETYRPTDSGTVRRLTPTECERLQGFPVGWTIPRDKWTGWTLPKGLDSARYRALGNAVTTNVVYWIVLRINMVEDMLAATAGEVRP